MKWFPNTTALLVGTGWCTLLHRVDLWSISSERRDWAAIVRKRIMHKQIIHQQSSILWDIKLSVSVFVDTHTHTHILWSTSQQLSQVFLPHSGLSELHHRPVWEHTVLVSQYPHSSRPCHTPVNPLSETHCRVIKSHWVALGGSRLTQPAVTHQSGLRVGDLTHWELRTGAVSGPQRRPQRKPSTPSRVCASLGFELHTFNLNLLDTDRTQSCWFSVLTQGLC